MIKIPLVCALTVVSLHAADVGFGPALAPGMTIPYDAPVVPTDSGHGPNPALPPAARTRLDELAPDLATQDWGSLQVNRAVAGTPLTIAGRGFTNGLGTHARSEISYDLDQQFDSFSAWTGVDDHLKNHPEAGKASVEFQVIGDDRILWASGVMRMGDEAKRVELSVAGVSQLKLLVTDANDGKNCDHADWAEPILTGRPRIDAAREAKSEVTARDITVRLDKDGGIVNAVIGQQRVPWPVTGETLLRGFRAAGEITVSRAGHEFTRKLADAQGRTCTITERFTPDGDSIKWEVEINSPDAPWTAPVLSRLKCAMPEQTLIWTGWGSPDLSGARLTPELTALVQMGKAAVSGDWSDPLAPAGFVNRRWHYGNTSQACPVGGDYVALPLFTMLTPGTDTGLSLVLAPDDVLLNIDLSVSANGQFQYARTNHRLGGGRSVKFTMHLVPHEASWRGGLRFMTARYPRFFEAPNPRAHQIAGCGAYSISEAPIDVAKFRNMAFGFNWKLSDDFPYMGMFLPPVNEAEQQWTRSCSEPCPPGKGPATSARQMNDYARYMRENGFSVLSYFNVTEFGKNVDPRRGGLPAGVADDPELWKDCSAFLRAKLPNAWLRISANDRTEWGATGLPNGLKGLMSNCYGAAIVDPGDPDYLEFLLEQCRRHIKWLPDTDGICIDRTDWLRYFNALADDGVSWKDGKPARSLYRSWAELMARMGPLMHRSGKVVFCNLMAMRLELGRELDGIYTEFGNNGNALNASALLGTRKPVVAWTYNESLRQPNPDAFMQRHLHLGVFPTAPYPYNNHCINPEPDADRIYLAYGPLLNAMRGRKWVLTPHCVETSAAGVKVNLFDVPGGYALPVTFGDKLPCAVVQLRNLPDLDRLQAVVVHPGVERAASVPASFKNGVLELAVPLHRGCAMVKLTNP